MFKNGQQNTGYASENIGMIKTVTILATYINFG
jgi:hypothetical protein